MTSRRPHSVKLTLRVSPSVARDIDVLVQKEAWGSRGSVVRDSLLSFFRGDFNPFPLGSGHADFPEHWGRLLPRPVDTLVKRVKEPRSIRITFRISPALVASVDAAVKRRAFANPTAFIRAVLVAFLSWRSSHPDTLVKSRLGATVVPPSVMSIASNFSFSSGESER